MMDLIQVSSYPQNKKSAQDKLINDLQKQLFVEKSEKEMTSEELFNLLRSKHGG